MLRIFETITPESGFSQDALLQEIAALKNRLDIQGSLDFEEIKATYTELRKRFLNADINHETFTHISAVIYAIRLDADSRTGNEPGAYFAALAGLLEARPSVAHSQAYRTAYSLPDEGRDRKKYVFTRKLSRYVAEYVDNKTLPPLLEEHLNSRKYLSMLLEDLEVAFGDTSPEYALPIIIKAADQSYSILLKKLDNLFASEDKFVRTAPQDLWERFFYYRDATPNAPEQQGVDFLMGWGAALYDLAKEYSERLYVALGKDEVWQAWDFCTSLFIPGKQYPTADGGTVNIYDDRLDIVGEMRSEILAALHNRDLEQARTLMIQCAQAIDSYQKETGSRLSILPARVWKRLRPLMVKAQGEENNTPEPEAKADVPLSGSEAKEPVEPTTTPALISAPALRQNKLERTDVESDEPEFKFSAPATLKERLNLLGDNLDTLELLKTLREFNYAQLNDSVQKLLEILLSDQSFEDHFQEIEAAEVANEYILLFNAIINLPASLVATKELYKIMSADKILLINRVIWTLQDKYLNSLGQAAMEKAAEILIGKLSDVGLGAGAVISVPEDYRILGRQTKAAAELARILGSLEWYRRHHTIQIESFDRIRKGFREATLRVPIREEREANFTSEFVRYVCELLEIDNPLPSGRAYRVDERIADAESKITAFASTKHLRRTGNMDPHTYNAIQRNAEKLVKARLSEELQTKIIKLTELGLEPQTFRIPGTTAYIGVPQVLLGQSMQEIGEIFESKEMQNLETELYEKSPGLGDLLTSLRISLEWRYRDAHKSMLKSAVQTILNNFASQVCHPESAFYKSVLPAGEHEAEAINLLRELGAYIGEMAGASSRSAIDMFMEKVTRTGKLDILNSAISIFFDSFILAADEEGYLPVYFDQDSEYLNFAKRREEMPDLETIPAPIIKVYNYHRDELRDQNSGSWRMGQDVSMLFVKRKVENFLSMNRQYAFLSPQVVFQTINNVIEYWEGNSMPSELLSAVYTQKTEAVLQIFDFYKTYYSEQLLMGYKMLPAELSEKQLADYANRLPVSLDSAAAEKFFRAFYLEDTQSKTFQRRKLDVRSVREAIAALDQHYSSDSASDLLTMLNEFTGLIARANEEI